MIVRDGYADRRRAGKRRRGSLPITRMGRPACGAVG
jgi:hypothetical protein